MSSDNHRDGHGLPDLLVFVDIPDADNVLCCLSVLKANPYQHVNIVLTPRPIDFSVKLYGDNWKRIRAQMEPNLEKHEEIRRMMTPFLSPPAWIQDMKAQLSQDENLTDLLEYCEPDRGFESDSVRTDTRVYMELSALRFASFLCARDIDPLRFTFYWDDDSMNKITVGVRHARHVSDYTYGFSATALEEFRRASELPDPKDRRQARLSLCQEYITAERRTRREIGLEQVLFPYQELLDRRRSLPKDSVVSVVIGGPFTEALKWLHAGLPMTRVTAMACYISGDNNIFQNQFNVHCDPQSAWDFFNLVQERRIPTLLVPTECIKDNEWKLSKYQLHDVFDGHPQAKQVVEKFTHQSGTFVDANLFDWVAAIIARRPDIIKTRKVEPLKESMQVADAVNGNASTQSPPFVLKMKPIESSIEMCWTEPGKADVSTRKQFHDMLISEMRKDLDSISVL